MSVTALPSRCPREPDTRTVPERVEYRTPPCTADSPILRLPRTRDGQRSATVNPGRSRNTSTRPWRPSNARVLLSTEAEVVELPRGGRRRPVLGPPPTGRRCHGGTRRAGGRGRGHRTAPGRVTPRDSCSRAAGGHTGHGVPFLDRLRSGRDSTDGGGERFPGSRDRPDVAGMRGTLGNRGPSPLRSEG